MRKIVLLLIVSVSMVGCDFSQIFGAEKDDEEGSGAEITAFRFPIEKNATIDSTIDGYVDSETQIVTVRLPSEIVALETALVAEVELSGGASISPDPTEGRPYKADVYYDVTAEDGSRTKTFVVQSSVASGALSAQVVDFRFEGSNPENAEITGTYIATVGGNTIYAILPYQALQLTTLTLEPTITVTDGATISPSGPQNYKSAVSYTVTGADGKTNTYNVSISVDPDSI